MKGFVLDGFDTEPRLRDDLPEPEPGEGELAARQGFVGQPGRQRGRRGLDARLRRVRVPRDPRPGLRRRRRKRRVRGRFAEGDEVFGLLQAVGPNVQYGSWAELGLVPVEQAALKPSGPALPAGGGADGSSGEASSPERQAGRRGRSVALVADLRIYPCPMATRPKDEAKAEGTNGAASDGAPDTERQQAAVDEDLHRYIAPVTGPDEERRDHRLRDRDQAPLRGGRRQAGPPGAPRRAGRVPVHARHPPGHVPRPALDDAPVRRLREPRGHERALSLPDGARLDRPFDGLRSAHPAGPRLGRSALRRRGRPHRRAHRHPRGHADLFRPDRPRRGLDLDDDQRARRDPAAALRARRRGAGRAGRRSSAARSRTTSSRSTCRAATTSTRPSRRCG